MFGEEGGNGDIQGLPFLAKWQMGKPSVAGAPSGMKVFFPHLLGVWGDGSPQLLAPLGIISCEESQLAKVTPSSRGTPHPMTENSTHKGPASSPLRQLSRVPMGVTRAFSGTAQQLSFSLCSASLLHMWIQEHIILNMLHSNLWFRVCFLGDVLCNISHTQKPTKITKCV